MDEMMAHLRLSCLAHALDIAKSAGENDVHKIVKTAEIFWAFVEADVAKMPIPHTDEIPF